MKRTISTILLSAFLLAPVTVFGDDHHHQWSDAENDHWRQWLKEHHKKDHDWDHAKEREKRQYWKWRDAHPDDHDHH